MKLFKLLFLIVISLNINVLMAEVDIGNEQNNSPESINLF